MGEWTDFGTRIVSETLRWIEGFGYAEKSVRCYSSPIVPNGFSPYTVEQTIRVTHYNKPNRRDPARKINR